MPPEVLPPFLFGNYVDCVGWSQLLDRYRKLSGAAAGPARTTAACVAPDGLRSAWPDRQQCCSRLGQAQHVGVLVARSDCPPGAAVDLRLCGGYAPPPCLAGRQGNDLPPVYYTISSTLNLFSFPALWASVTPTPSWATADRLTAIRKGLQDYIKACISYNGGKQRAPGAQALHQSHPAGRQQKRFCNRCVRSSARGRCTCWPNSTSSLVLQALLLLVPAGELPLPPTTLGALQPTASPRQPRAFPAPTKCKPPAARAASAASTPRCVCAWSAAPHPAQPVNAFARPWAMHAQALTAAN